MPDLLFEVGTEELPSGACEAALEQLEALLKERLAEARLAADSVEKLYFPKMMLWGTGSLRFARPIRWILALLDSDVVPMEIAGIESGRSSRGHRFLAHESFEVTSPTGFLDRLREAYVMVDPA